MADYCEAVRLGPDEEANYEAVAAAANSLKATDQAQSLYSEILRDSPTNYLALLFRGTLARDSGSAGAAADMCGSVRAEPRLSRAYDALVPVWPVGNRDAEGVAFYTEVIAAHPDLPLPYAYRAALHAAAGRTNDYLADAAQAIKLAPRSAWPLVKRGNWYRSAKQPDLAVADLAAAVRLEPTDESANTALRAAASGEDRVEAVLKALGDIIGTAPRLRRPRLTRARSPRPASDRHRPRRLYGSPAARPVRRHGRGRPGPCRYRRQQEGAGIDFCTSQLRRRRWDDQMYLARGRIFLADNDAASASADFAEVVRLNPRSAAGFAGKAQAAMAAKRFDEARDDAVRAIKLDPNSSWDVYTTLNRSCAAKEDFAAAIACYSAVLARSPEAEKPLWQRALAYEGAGNLPLALADLDVSARVTPNDKLVFVARGRIKMKLKQPKAAVADFSEWARLAPFEPAAFFQRGLAYRESGDLDRALADFEKVTGLNSKLARAYVEQSKIFNQRGKFDQAILAATTATGLTPDDPEAWFERAFAHSEKKEYAQAVADYSQVIQRRPRANAYNNRGWNQAKLGQQALAIADYTKAIELDPASRIAYENLIRAYEANKDTDTAAKVRAKLGLLDK